MDAKYGKPKSQTEKSVYYTPEETEDDWQDTKARMKAFTESRLNGG